MKKIVLLAIVSFLLIGFYACKNEEELSLKNQDNSEEGINLNLTKLPVKGIQVLNGRIYFPDKETFKSYYKNLKDQEEESIAKILEADFYSKGFFSLVPLVNDDTEGVQVKRHLEMTKKVSISLGGNAIIKDEEVLENYEKLEGLYNEDVFMSILNQEAELQIGEDIYKYTDTGLFIGKAESIKELNKYLDGNRISRDPMTPTETANRVYYSEQNNPCGGISNVDNYQYYIASVDTDCSNDGGGYGNGSGNGGSSSGGSSGGSSGTPYADLAVISNDLAQCSGSSPWFGNLFGTVKVCIDKYESKKRVKIKYYDIDLFLAYAVGIKVKHQKKGWTGLWRKQSTDEVALGINSLSWQFTPPQSSLPITNYQPARIYLYDGRMYETINGYYNAVYAGNFPIPNLPFADDVDFIVEFAINAPFSPFNDEEDVREFFYQQLFNTAKNVLESNSNRQTKKIGLVVHTLTQNWVQYYDFSSSCTNCSKKERIFDFGIATPQVTYTFGTGNGGNFSVANFNFDFNTPNVVGMNGFGMAKRNGQWHGRRMVF